MKKSLFLAVSLITLVACSRNQEIHVPDVNLTLIAKTESPTDSRTVVEGGTHVYWEPGDEIMVFSGEKSAKFTTDITASSATATFKGTFGEETWPEDIELWAVYPFNEEAVFDGETITTTLPSEQVARAGSFEKDMNLAIANSFGTTLQFYNVGGGIRFSITEDGIKKVLFEGLDGEIISGMIKIGFEEGLPEVQEIICGSQFITLLPPDGSETFEKDTWYYIVAIPGTLEKGYKLRFYKETDYARKISEKAVQIKRSIYGSLEKADEGIEYEPQMTHFPETKEEWRESVDYTYSINNKINSLLRPTSDTVRPIDQDIIDSIKEIEGVIAVRMAADSSSIAFQQRDSVWCNYLIKKQSEPIIPSNEELEGNTASSVSYRKQPKFASGNFTHSGRALIYVPFQWHFNKPIPDWQADLNECFGPENVITMGKVNDHDDGGILDLKDALSEHYDLIILDTHGFVGPTESTEKGQDSSPDKTLLATSTIYSSEVVEELHNNGIDDNQFGNAYEDGVSYVCFSPDFLGNKRFDDSAVILSACKSAQLCNYTENDDKGSMIGGFINRGAAIATGAKVTMSSQALGIFVRKMIELLRYGCPFQDAFTYLSSKNGRVDNWLNYLYRYLWLNHPKKMLDDSSSFSDFNIPDNYIIRCNNKYPDPYFLLLVDPLLYEPDQSGENITFTWECALNDFVLQWPVGVEQWVSDWKIKEDIIYQDVSYLILYDVYVDGNPLFNDCSDKIASGPLPPGPHNWYIVTRIMDGDNVLTTYQSVTQNFTVEQQSPGGEIEETYEEPWN